jgi:hypothetical protein
VVKNLGFSSQASLQVFDQRHENVARKRLHLVIEVRAIAEQASNIDGVDVLQGRTDDRDSMQYSKPLPFRRWPFMTRLFCRKDAVLHPSIHVEVGGVGDQQPKNGSETWALLKQVVHVTKMRLVLLVTGTADTV